MNRAKVMWGPVARRPKAEGPIQPKPRKPEAVAPQPPEAHNIPQLGSIEQYKQDVERFRTILRYVKPVYKDPDTGMLTQRLPATFPEKKTARKADVRVPVILRPDVQIRLPRVFEQAAKQVAVRHKMSVAEILAPSRKARLVAARAELMWEMRTRHEWSFKRIGSHMSMDHSTVMHHVAKHARKIGL